MQSRVFFKSQRKRLVEESNGEILTSEHLANSWLTAFKADNQQMNMFFDQMLDGFAYHKIIVDRKGKPIDYIFLEVNQAFEKLTSLKKQDVIGKKATEVLKDIENDPADWIGVYGQVALTGKPVRFEQFAKALDKWFRISAYSPERNYFVALFEDITLQKRNEDELRKANEELEERVRKRTEEVSRERHRLFNVLETLPVYVILLDKDYRVPFANKFFREHFGEPFGRRCYEYLFNRTSACENCETYKVLKTKTSHNWEWTGPDGHLYDIHDFPFVEADGSNLILEMGIDVTEQRRAEEKIRDASLYARSLIEASLDPLVTISPEGKITDVNRATELVTGVSREKLIGSDFSSYFTEPEKAAAGYKQVFTRGFVKDYPLAIRHKMGKITEVMYNASVYRNADGSVQGVFAAARDITEQKKLEKQVQDSERLATIGATAGMVGHDIRNPLQAVISDIYLAKTDLASFPDGEEKKSIQESLDSIAENSEYINKVIADLQDYSKPLIPLVEEVDLPSIINGLLKKNGLMENIKVHIRIEEEASRLMADAVFIKRIVGNLVTNAVQAMPKGGMLSLTAHKEADATMITVEDTGVGIPESVRQNIFTPLFTTKSRGQGFGLAVVKRLTEALGGAISLESQEGKGTKFTVRLPQPQRAT